MNKYSSRPHPYALLFLLACLLLVFTLVVGQQPARAGEEEPPVTEGDKGSYFSRTSLAVGKKNPLDQVKIKGPPKPPPGILRKSLSLDEMQAGAGSVLLPVPAYDWYYGCSATSAAMIAAYYDRNGYDDIYTGPTNGGVMPTDGRVWGVFADSYAGRYYQCPLTASRNGLDGRTTRGSIEDYWVYYYAPVATFPDPFITAGWTEHDYGDAIGDFMRTGQSNFSNIDGSTTFYEFSDGTPTTCDFIDDYVFDDGSVGRKLFYEARGYTVTDCFNQKTNNTDPDGFSFAQYMAEIDAGRPVLINVTGHSMVGIGYDAATNKVYLNDTWDNVTHTMTWGGSYSGMTMEAVSIVNLSPADVDVRTLLVSKNGTGSGSIASTPAGINCGTTTMDCYENFATGTSVTLTATPSTGSYFTGWSGDCSGTGTCIVTMDEPHSVTATFNIYTLTVGKSGTGSGTVTSEPAGISCGTDCTENFAPGTVVTLVATPAPGALFTGWSGACTGTGACVVVMDDSKSVTAAFTAYTLTVSKSGTGSGTVTSQPAGINCGSDCSESFPLNTVVTLVATPSSTSSFAGWGGACSGTGSCMVTMDATKSVTASFTLTSYSLEISKAGTGVGTVKSDPVGVVCGVDCQESFVKGSAVTLTAWGKWYATFVGWSGACSGTSSTCTLVMDSPRNVTATFNLKSYLLTVNRDGTGSGTVTSSPVGIACGSDCTEAFTYGTSVTLIPTPAVNSSFTGWSGACTGTGSCTLSITAAKTVTATFALNTVSFDLAVIKSGTGSGTVTSTPSGISCGSDCSETFTANTLVTLNAVASTGSTFSGWSGACSGTGGCTVSMVSAKSVTATFTLNPITYTLAVNRSGTGSGTVTSTPSGISCGSDCSEAFTANTLVTLSAVASSGSTFTGWSGACTGTGGCTVSMVSAKSVTATFTLNPITYTLAVNRSGTGSGTVTSTPSGISCGSDCSEAFTANTLVTLNAVASSGSTFSGWNGACTGTGGCTVSMISARSVTATFTLNSLTYTLAVVRSGTGSGTVTSSPVGISCGSDCSEAYAANAIVTLSAVASSGSTFTGWSGACTGTGGCTVSMISASSVTATFTLNSLTYTLAVVRSGTGSGTVTSLPLGISCGYDCYETYAANTVVKLTAVAKSGSTFTGWTGACGGTGSCWVTMSKSRSVTAGFISVPPGAFYLGVTKAGTGTGTVTSTPSGISCGTTCAQIYASGILIKLTAVASPGSTFAGWSGDCGGTGYCWVVMSTTRYVKATFNLTSSYTNPPNKGDPGFNLLGNQESLASQIPLFNNVIAAGDSSVGYWFGIREIRVIFPFTMAYFSLHDGIGSTFPPIYYLPDC